MRDNNFGTEVGDGRFDQVSFIGEEMRYPRKIGENKNPRIYSADKEPEEEMKLATNILLQEYGRPKQEAGSLVRMSRSQKVKGIKRNLIQNEKRGKSAFLVQMEKRPRIEQMAKRSGLVRTVKRPNLLQMIGRPQKVTGIKKNQMLRMM